MKQLLFAVLAVALITATAHAQTSVAVNINTARLSWDWDIGTGGQVDRFIMRCGPSSGNYTVNHEIADPAARSVPVLTVVKQPGTYFCAVAATNAFGTSANSNEISFVAGDVPVPATNLRIEAQ